MRSPGTLRRCIESATLTFSIKYDHSHDDCLHRVANEPLTNASAQNTPASKTLYTRHGTGRTCYTSQTLHRPYPGGLGRGYRNIDDVDSVHFGRNFGLRRPLIRLLAFETILRGLDLRNGLQCPCVREGLFQRTLPRFFVITPQTDTSGRLGSRCTSSL